MANLADLAQSLLGVIRLINGVGALFAPEALGRRLGIEPSSNPAAIYALRLFGIRTIIIGAELLLAKGEVRAQSVRLAPIIHASDTASAFLAGAQGQLPEGTARLATIISTVNVVLSILAQPSTASAARRPRRR